MVEERVCRGVGVVAARAYGHLIRVRLYDLASAGDEQHALAVGGEHHGLEVPRALIGAPGLREGYRGPLEVAAGLLERRLEFLGPAKPVMTLPL